MSRIVAIDLHISSERLLLRPRHDPRVLDAMLGQTRLGRNRAQRKCDLRRIQVERALDTRGEPGQNESCVALEALGPAVDHRYHRRLIEHIRGLVVLQQAEQQAVHPASRQNRVQTAHDQIELTIEVDVHVLDAFAVRDHVTVRQAFAYELGGTFGFRTTYVGLAKQKLSIEIGQVDGVHVDDVNVREAHVGEVFEQLAAESAGAHDQKFDLTQTLEILAAWLEVLLCERRRALE